MSTRGIDETGEGAVLAASEPRRKRNLSTADEDDGAASSAEPILDSTAWDELTPEPP
ncbi:MAG: hypothetical protein R3F37_03055 [Candidatus Competibacteraceae bacterium]